MLANKSVMATEEIETITEFLKGVISPPESKRVLKLFKVQVLGSASGVE